MTVSAIAESSTEKDVLMAFPPENGASSTRVAPLPQNDSLLEFSVDEDRTPVGPVSTDRRRRKSASWASGPWRAVTSEVVRDGRWFKDLQRLRSRAMGQSSRLRRSPVIISESSTGPAALKAFVPEDQTSSIRVAPLPHSDPLLEFSSEEDRALVDADRARVDADRTLVDADRRHKSSPLASEAWRAFTSQVAWYGRRCLTWLWTCQADLKVGLYKVAGSLHEIAGSLAVAVRVRSQSINQRLRLRPSVAWATLSALVMRGSASASRRTFHTRRALIPFGFGLATGVVVTLYLPVLSIPGATMPAPGAALSPPASLALNVPLVPSVRPSANARSVGAGTEQTVVTAGNMKQDQTSAVLPSQPPTPSPRKESPAQPTASRKLMTYSGSLAVDSAPTGARVLVNGVPVGTTPLLLKDLPVGSRVVHLELDGYERWSSAVRVVANQRVRIAADLQPSPSDN